MVGAQSPGEISPESHPIMCCNKDTPSLPFSGRFVYWLQRPDIRQRSRYVVGVRQNEMKDETSGHTT